ncbi:MAG: SPFH domain-containing protein [Clostridia bacterium]|nr:SPFH domain-containing protein [Clostridia bacterium]
MGILSVIGDSVNSTLKDQYLEVFTVESLGQDVLVKRGHRKNTNGNNKGSDDVVSDGSMVIVPEGCAAVIIDAGDIKETVTKAGTYKVNNSSGSIFGSGGLKSIAGEIFERVKFGAEIPHTERIYFVNMLEIRDNTASSESAIPFKDKDYRIMYLKAHITFSYKIVNPGIFITNVTGCVDEEFRAEELSKGMIITEVNDYVIEAVNKLSGSSSFADVMSHMSELKESVVKYINDIWREKRGMEIYAVTMNFSVDEASRARAEQFDQGKIFGEDPKALAAAAILGETQAMNTAASNMHGGVRIVSGMNVGNVLGNMSKQPSAFTCPYCNFIHDNGVPMQRRCEACGNFFSDSDIKGKK